MRERGKTVSDQLRAGRGPADAVHDLRALRVLNDYLQCSDEPVPEGFKDAMAWAQAWGVSRCTALMKLQRGAAAGLFDRIQTKRGRHHTFYFRFKQ